MIPTTDAYKDRVLKPHIVVHKLQINREDIVWEGHATDGNLTLDSDSKVCRSMDLTINEDVEALVPHINTDILTPFGTEIRAWRGLRYPDGTEELIPLGIFVIQKSRTIESGQGLQILLDCHDLSKRVRDARFERTIAILENSNLGASIQKVIQEVAPWVVFDSNFALIATDKTTGMVFQQGDDPWDAAYKMAFDAGYRLCFNVEGRLMLKHIPAADGKAGDPVWTFTEGDGGNLLYADKEHTTEATYNKVIVVGEPTDGSPPVTGIASDTNPNSPTYIYGPFGVRPYFYKSPFIRTKTQAQNTAAMIFLRHLGFQENMHIQGIPMEALEEDDIIHITRARAKIDADYIINKITLPLTQDRAQDITMAQRNVGGFSLT